MLPNESFSHQCLPIFDKRETDKAIAEAEQRKQIQKEQEKRQTLEEWMKTESHGLDPIVRAAFREWLDEQSISISLAGLTRKHRGYDVLGNEIWERNERELIEWKISRGGEVNKYGNEYEVRLNDDSEDPNASYYEISREGYLYAKFLLEQKSSNLAEADTPIEVTGKEFGEFDTSTAEGKKALREKAFEYIKQLADSGESVYCSALKSDVGFNSSGAKKFKSLGGNPIKNKLAFAIKNIIKHSTLVKADVESYDIEERKKGITYSILKAKVAVEGIEYGVRTVVRHLANGKYHYDLQIRDNYEVIIDDVNRNEMKLGRLTKSDTLHLISLGQTDLAENNTTILDDVQAENGYVLNLFVFDADGNPISDEEEEMVENNEENEMASNSEQEKTVHTEAQIRFLQDVIDGKVDALAQDFHDKFAKVAEQVVDTHSELLEQAVNAYIKVVDDYAARIEAEEKA